MKTPMTHRVFVYGTLKRGYRNWSWALKDRAHFAGEATSPVGYRMLCVGFPVMMETGDGPMAVAGELFHVDDATLADLDRLESEGRMYLRKVIDVLENGKPVQAYAYIGHPDRWNVDSNAPHYFKTNAAGALEWSR